MESTGKDRNYQIGLILVILGGLALLANFGLFRGLNHLVGALFFAFLGGLALRHYQRKRRTGSLIGAFVLFGLAAAAVTDALSGFFFLGLIGVGFGAVYYLDRERWWAIIPAGTMITLAVVAALDELAPRYESGSVLFIGLAATFLLLYRLPGDPKRWALYPAIACGVLAVLGLSVGGTWILPLALVGVGVYLLYRRNGERHEAMAEGPEAAPAESPAAAPVAAGGDEGTAADGTTAPAEGAQGSDPDGNASLPPEEPGDPHQA